MAYLIIENQKLEQTGSFKYLESIITWNRRCTDKTRSKLASRRVAFSRARNLLTREIHIKLQEICQSLIWSTVMYVLETWTIRKKRKYLEKF